jgi:hypothetical protein
MRDVARPIEVLVESGIEITTARQLADIGIAEEYPADGEYYLSGDIDLSPLWDVEKGGEAGYVWRGIGSTCRECGAPLLSADKINHTLPLRCENRDCVLYLQSQQPFSGMLHGNGNTIKGLKLPAASAGGTGYEEALYFGLFGFINTAYIHDLTVEVANNKDERAAYSSPTAATVNAKPSFGVLAGVARGSRIENVSIIPAATTGAGLYVSGPVSATTSAAYIGGVIGQGFNTLLANVSSESVLDVTGVGIEYTGGIAGSMTGTISGAKVLGNINVYKDGDKKGSNVAGICAETVTTPSVVIQGCKVKMESLTATSNGGSISGIGTGNITDCSVDIDLIKGVINYTSGAAGGFTVGGISAKPTSDIERCDVSFATLEVSTATDKTAYGTTYIGGIFGISGNTAMNCVVKYKGGGGVKICLPNATSASVYVGGIAGNITGSTSIISQTVIQGESLIKVATGASSTINIYVGGLVGTGPSSGTGPVVSNSKVDRQTITVNHTGTTGGVYVGGLVGSGHVSNSGVTDQAITVTTATTGVVRAGGLTGNGTARQSFTGTNAKHATLTVTKTDATSTSSANYAYVGGISGQTAPTSAFQFENNYAFCDVTLVSAGIINGTSGYQAAGGLVGYFSGNTTSTFVRYSFAAGRVTVTNNYSTGGGAVYAGGIAGYKNNGTNAANIKISACAALNSAITIDGSNSSATKNWRRIATIGDKSTQLEKNIAKVGGTKPEGVTLDEGLAAKDGLAVESITEDTFFGTEDGQLGWSRDVWAWDAESKYPVLK